MATAVDATGCHAIKEGRERKNWSQAWSFKGGPEKLRHFFGKWVAVDANGEIRAAGTSFDEAASLADVAQVQEPEFVYVPAESFAG